MNTCQCVYCLSSVLLLLMYNTVLRCKLGNRYIRTCGVKKGEFKERECEIFDDYS